MSKRLDHRTLEEERECEAYSEFLRLKAIQADQKKRDLARGPVKTAAEWQAEIRQKKNDDAARAEVIRRDVEKMNETSHREMRVQKGQAVFAKLFEGCSIGGRIGFYGLIGIGGFTAVSLFALGKSDDRTP